jgi:ATP-dependent Clp protease ATP-binding subunit ClpB
VGYDPAYGARPLKRVLQKELETGLGRMLLQGKVRDGQTVVVSYDSAGDRLTYQARETVQQEEDHEPEQPEARQQGGKVAR